MTQLTAVRQPATPATPREAGCKRSSKVFYGQLDRSLPGINVTQRLSYKNGLRIHLLIETVFARRLVAARQVVLPGRMNMTGNQRMYITTYKLTGPMR